MLEDAKRWLNSGRCEDVTHPKTGATALHVAAAKGYIKVMSVLLQAGADVNNHDNDGWTPLHAAAYWGQKEACELLIENFCDMDIKNYVDQTAFDVADSDMQRTLEELKKKQAALQRDRGDVTIVQKKEVNAKKRISANDKTNVIRRDNASERHGLERTISEEETVDRVKKVELEIKSDSQQDSGIPVNDTEVGK
ncbi:unnamed protein product, partial [Timema podura]|nr:unnamed protein product [Timema podura]